MGLMFGKLALLAYRDRALTHRHPAADTFALLAANLTGAIAFRRVDDHGVAVDRDGRDPLLVLWAPGDPFAGEDEPPVDADLPWPAPTATAVDAFGEPHPVSVRAGRLRTSRSVTPVFVTV
jgi:hypothetical protein